MNKPLRILFVEDSESDMELLLRELRRGGYAPYYQRVDSPDEMSKALSENVWDIVLSDYTMPSFSAHHALETLKQSNHPIPFIVVSGTIGEESAVALMRAGAQDYIIKNNLVRLTSSMERAIRESEARQNLRQAEADLRDSRAQFKNIIASAMDAIITVDERQRITLFNLAAERMFGCAAAEALGKPVDIFIPERFREAHAEHLRVFAETTPNHDALSPTSVVAKHTDGSEFPVETSISQTTANGRRLFTVILRDISERVRAESELRETNQQLEEALHQVTAMTQQLWQASKLATMGELAASIAHELNNPLATLALRTEAIATELPAEDPQQAGLAIIAQEVERMADLVRNLLEFSRRSHKQMSTLDIRVELNNSIEFVHYHTRTHQIEVDEQYADDVPLIQGDRQQLRQVFLNLLTNAFDAMQGGGRLSIRARRTTTENGGEAALVEFSDTGAGVSAEDLEKLWEPFFTTKPEGKGTGLGLPICRRTIEEHRGTITIRSVQGEGTTVSIILPASDERENS